MGWLTAKKRLRQLEQENAQLCQENAQLRQDKTRLQVQVAALETEKARLLAQLAGAKKNSSNSSKPPLSKALDKGGYSKVEVIRR